MADYDGRTGELRALYVTPFLDENLMKEDFTGPGPILAWYTQDGLGSVRQLVVGDAPEEPLVRRLPPSPLRGLPYAVRKDNPNVLHGVVTGNNRIRVEAMKQRTWGGDFLYVFKWRKRIEFHYWDWWPFGVTIVVFPSLRDLWWFQAVHVKVSAKRDDEGWKYERSVKVKFGREAGNVVFRSLRVSRWYLDRTKRSIELYPSSVYFGAVRSFGGLEGRRWARLYSLPYYTEEQWKSERITSIQSLWAYDVPDVFKKACLGFRDEREFVAYVGRRNQTEKAWVAVEWRVRVRLNNVEPQMKNRPVGQWLEVQPDVAQVEVLRIRKAKVWYRPIVVPGAVIRK